jgi:hypothetical protein
MFVQVITATVLDPVTARALRERWERDVRPGATGYLGSIGGVTADGRVVVAARFESAEAARANSERPEQDAWWCEMSRTVDGVRFHDSVRVDSLLLGPADAAGFVQVIRGRIVDAGGLDALRADIPDLEAIEKQHRPEIVGELLAEHGDGTYTEVVWFRSEEAARAGERADQPPELRAVVDRVAAVLRPEEFYDLTDPWTW